MNNHPNIYRMVIVQTLLCQTEIFVSWYTVEILDIPSIKPTPQWQPHALLVLLEFGIFFSQQI